MCGIHLLTGGSVQLHDLRLSLLHLIAAGSDADELDGLLPWTGGRGQALRKDLGAEEGLAQHGHDLAKLGARRIEGEMQRRNRMQDDVSLLAAASGQHDRGC